MAQRETITMEAPRARIGEERVSDWVEVGQAMIDKFARATGDDQFIHVDPERAAQPAMIAEGISQIFA